MTTNGKRVVLCVDDEALGLSVRRMLLEAEGYRVLTAENGADALGLFSSERVDIVVLDYSMPGMNGNAVAKKMKTLRQQVPVIMLSAYVDLPSEAVVFADKSIIKGEPATVLLDSIAQLLGDGFSTASGV